MFDQRKALRLAYRTAAHDYMQAASADKSTLASILLYFRTKITKSPAPDIFAILGRNTGHLRCAECGRRFGDTDVLPHQGRRRYLQPPSCPHCGCTKYTTTTT